MASERPEQQENQKHILIKIGYSYMTYNIKVLNIYMLYLFHGVIEHRNIVDSRRPWLQV
jgi:hypothetical protein